MSARTWQCPANGCGNVNSNKTWVCEKCSVPSEESNKTPQQKRGSRRKRSSSRSKGRSNGIRANGADSDKEESAAGVQGKTITLLYSRYVPAAAPSTAMESDLWRVVPSDKEKKDKVMSLLRDELTAMEIARGNIDPTENEE